MVETLAPYYQGFKVEYAATAYRASQIGAKTRQPHAIA